MVSLAPHQMDAIRRLKNGNILVGGVGSGKSRTALGWWYFRVCQGLLPINKVGENSPMKTPRDLYIITTARKRDTLDWEGEMAVFGGLRTGLNDHGKQVPGVRIFVDSWNNLHKYSETKDACFIFDEQRIVGYGQWVKNFIKIARGGNIWILLSATPGDVWSDYIPVFVANGFYRNKTQFNNRHAVFNRFSKFPKIDRYTEENILMGYKKRITVDMEMTRHTVRHQHIVNVEYDRTLADHRITKMRWNPYEDKPILNVSEYTAVLRKAIFDDPSRQKALRKLTLERSRVIVFYTYDHELERIREVGRSLEKEGYGYAEWNGHIHEEVPDGEKWMYVVQYSAGSEAWNCITTDTIIFYSQSYSYRQMEQSRGRIDRMNTPYIDLHYYVFKSRSGLDRAIAKALANKKKFNETRYYGGMFEKKEL